MTSILVVDDDDVYDDAFAQLLGACGYPVERAATLHEARAFLEKRSYQLVLLAPSMPDGVGSDLLPALSGRCPRARVVILTGYVRTPRFTEAMRARIQDFLPKTLPPAQVLQRVQSWVAKAQPR